MPSRTYTATWIALAVFALATDASAEDWPQFRGPGGQGHSSAKGLPLKWSNATNVAWKVKVDGEGWSSPAIVGKQIFLTSAVATEPGNRSPQSLRLICLDADDGKEQWNIEVFKQPAAKIHRKNSHASPTPIVDGGHVFVHFGTHGTACLTLDGKVVWKQDDIVYDPRHGNGGSPVLTDELLIFSCDGGDKAFVIALDRKSGKIRWNKTRPEVKNNRTFSFSTPLLIEVAGQQQLISVGSDLIMGYDPATGNEIWRESFDGYSVIPRPVYGHGLLYCSTSYNNAQLLAVRPGGGKQSSEIAWRARRGAPHTPSALLVGDELYFVSDRGIASCVDAKTGKVHWQERVGGNYSASPLYGDGRIYLQSEEGVGTVIAAGKQYQELAKNDMKARTLASYAVVDSDFLIRTQTELYRIEK